MLADRPNRDAIRRYADRVSWFETAGLHAAPTRRVMAGQVAWLAQGTPAGVTRTAS